MENRNDEFVKYVKKELIEQKMTMRELSERINERYKWGMSTSSFSNKLYRGTFRYTDIVEILDCLGKKLVIVDND